MKWIFLLLLPLGAFSQNYNVDELKKLSEEKQRVVIKAAINSLEPESVIGYLRTLEDNNIDLKPSCDPVIAKASNLSWPSDLYNLVNILIRQQTDKPALENMLTSAISIWDKGEWSQKFWMLIKQNNLVLPGNELYTVNNLGHKIYNVELYLAQKQKAASWEPTRCWKLIMK